MANNNSNSTADNKSTEKNVVKDDDLSCYDFGTITDENGNVTGPQYECKYCEEDSATGVSVRVYRNNRERMPMRAYSVRMYQTVARHAGDFTFQGVQVSILRPEDNPEVLVIKEGRAAIIAKMVADAEKEALACAQEEHTEYMANKRKREEEKLAWQQRRQQQVMRVGKTARKRAAKKAQVA